MDALLGRMDRVRSLARRLVRDAAEADDLVQEAVAAALARPSQVHGDGEGWLGTVLRNLARDRRRSEGRRAVREEAAARPEGGGRDTARLVENAERQRDVVEAVLALEDPYREALLLRFFEDLPPREIVKRTGHAPEAVKKHLARGLAQLRTELEGRYGDRGRWAVALLPVIGGNGLGGLAAGGAAASTAAAWIPPGLLMRVVTAMALVAGLGLPVWVLWPGGAGGGPQAPVAGAPEPSALPAAEGAELAAVGDAAAREDAGGGAAVAPGGDHGAPDADAAALLMHREPVRLLDSGGQPLAGLEVRWQWRSAAFETPPAEPLEVTLTTDDGGRAVLEGPTYPDVDVGTWWVEGRSHVVAADARIRQETVLVLAPSVDVGGVTTDEGERPLADVEVSVWINFDAVPGFPREVLSFLGPRSRSVTSDEWGVFLMEGVPAHPSFQIHLDAPGRFERRVPLPQETQLDLELEVGAPRPAGRWMTGSVVLPGGAPAAGARVLLGWQRVEADAAGRFRVEVSQDDQRTLVARVDDGRFVSAPCPAAAFALEDGEVLEDAVVLRIPGGMEGLYGRLVDGAGEPVEGVEVILFDGTRDGGSMGFLEQGDQGAQVETARDGRFHFPLCAPRPYRLRLVDTRTMVVVDAGPLEPGRTEHVVTWPSDPFVPRLEGQVLDLHGEPLADVRVSLQVCANGPEDSLSTYRSGRATRTDGEGRFVIEEAPWRGLTLAVQARDGSPTADFPLGDTPPAGPLTLRAELDARVELASDRAEVVAIEVLDARGARLGVRCLEPGITTYRRSVRRTVAGAFPPFEVSQRAAELRLLGEAGELERIPVRLSVTGVNAPGL